MSDPILLERDGDVAELVLNRPERRNALDQPAVAAFYGALDELEKNLPRALLAAGRGEGLLRRAGPERRRAADRGRQGHPRGAQPDVLPPRRPAVPHGGGGAGRGAGCRVGPGPGLRPARGRRGGQDRQPVRRHRRRPRLGCPLPPLLADRAGPHARARLHRPVPVRRRSRRVGHRQRRPSRRRTARGRPEAGGHDRRRADGGLRAVQEHRRVRSPPAASRSTRCWPPRRLPRVRPPAPRTTARGSPPSRRSESRRSPVTDPAVQCAARHSSGQASSPRCQPPVRNAIAWNRGPEGAVVL